MRKFFTNLETRSSLLVDLVQTLWLPYIYIFDPYFPGTATRRNHRHFRTFHMNHIWGTKQVATSPLPYVKFAAESTRICSQEADDTGNLSSLVPSSAYMSKECQDGFAWQGTILLLQRTLLMLLLHSYSYWIIGRSSQHSFSLQMRSYFFALAVLKIASELRMFAISIPLPLC